jgi:hypothetical protein
MIAALVPGVRITVSARNLVRRSEQAVHQQIRSLGSQVKYCEERGGDVSLQNAGFFFQNALRSTGRPSGYTEGLAQIQFS